MKKHHFYIIFFLLLCIINEGYSQGLQFYGNEKRISERSSFCVFTEKYLSVATGTFTISFEYAAQNTESPGYIFYLKNADGQEAFNLTYVYDDSKGSFMFAQDGKQIYHAFPYPAAKLHAKWIPIIFKMDIPNDRINISIGNDQVTIEEIGLNKRTFTPQLFFGMCNYILETASFSIRNLKINNDEENWNFPLNYRTCHKPYLAHQSFVLLETVISILLFHSIGFRLCTGKAGILHIQSRLYHYLQYL